MIHKGMLGKIARGIYYIIHLYEGPETYLPDQHQGAKYIMRNRAYYIGYASVLEIYESKDPKDHHKLFHYFARNINKSVKKKFLFLTDLLGQERTAEFDRLLEELGTGYSLLDPSAPDQSRKMEKFGLKINFDPMLIREKVLNQTLY